jgi:thiamine biosynthesis lipoprotein
MTANATPATSNAPANSSAPAANPNSLTARLAAAYEDSAAKVKQLEQEAKQVKDEVFAQVAKVGDQIKTLEDEITALKQAIGSQHFDLNPDQLSITLHRSPMAFDLGGLGKGYALDQCADLLNQWSIHNALINAGNSTLLASGKLCGHSGWPVTLDADHHHRIIQLQDQALSASGFAEQGAHIIDPRSLRAIPTTQQRSYVIAPTAALADALSTTFQILSPTEARALCQKLPGIQHLQATHPAPDLP